MKKILFVIRAGAMRLNDLASETWTTEVTALSMERLRKRNGRETLMQRRVAAESVP